MQIFGCGIVKKMIFTGIFLKNRRLGGETARPRDEEMTRRKLKKEPLSKAAQ